MARLIAVLLLFGAFVDSFRSINLLPLGRRLLSVHQSSHKNIDTSTKIQSVSNYDTVQTLSENAIFARGTKEGLKDLQALSKLCKQRHAFDFDAMSNDDDDQTPTVISKLPKLIPDAVTRKIFDRVEVLLEKGLLSTNPDSVDGLPSFHLNLVSNGGPITADTPEQGWDEFQIEIQSMLDLVVPHIYESLLPHVNAKLGTNNIQVSDIFIRRYGQDVVEGKSRNGISAHYDVFSRVTSVIALDDVAKQGRNGLFTTASSFDRGLKQGTRTSNHAALRRFFPLSNGDAVIHTWDVLHGVDVEEGIDRTSLIVWFTEKDSETEGKGQSVSPWLQNHPNLKHDNVAQFVLASALESAQPLSLPAKENSKSRSQSMYQGVEQYNCDNDEGPLQKAIDLYLKSAAGGNSFAMSRVGSLIEEGLLDAQTMTKATEVVKQLRANSSQASYPRRIDSCEDPAMALARRFWYEASIRGNPLAQIALADEICAEETHAAEARLLAASLFSLAAQQGNEQAIESLTRLVEMEVSYGISSQEEFESNAVVQTAQMATLYL